MKKVSIILAAVLVVALALCACSSAGGASIVGKWAYTEEADGMSMTLVMEFKADGTGTATIEGLEALGGVTEFTYSTNGNNISVTMAGETSDGTYSISGNELTMTMDGETQILTRR